MSDFLNFLNTADMETLTQVPGVTRALALALADFRSHAGAFAHADSRARTFAATDFHPRAFCGNDADSLSLKGKCPRSLDLRLNLKQPAGERVFF